LKYDFQERTGIVDELLCPAWQAAERIVSLREVDEVVTISDMPKSYLASLVDAIPLVGDSQTFPYRNCKKLDLEKVDPQHVRVGQTFVQQDKCLGILGSFSKVFWGSAGTRGFAKQTAKIILGKVKGDFVVAHYLPPFIEEHGNEKVLLDGIHRQFICKGVGTTIESIVFRNMETRFPCDWQHWKNIKLVNAKPPKEERFLNLRPELFRDLKAIGIDG
jgi:hypothetical protein